MHNCFHAADILIPQHISLKKWACVACDQYSSEPEYWNRVADFVGSDPSTLNLIYPEAILREHPDPDRPEKIHGKMEEYAAQGFLRCYRRSFVYLERTMLNGKIRHGLVGQIDLEEYDYNPGCTAHIRATEGTVQERIPPRMELLRGARMEFPHVLLLCDDAKGRIMAAAEDARGEKVYDFDLMENGGRIRGWVISGMGVSVVNTAITEYIEATEAGKDPGSRMSFAVGDGNHSLASAKACWDELKGTLTEEERLTHPARFALVELENIHDEAIEFEPIHRVLHNADYDDFMTALRAISAPTGYPIEVLCGDRKETVYLSDRESPLALTILQPFLDRYMADHPVSIDYIHGEEVVARLAQEPDTIGLIVPGIEKDRLFEGVLFNGVLPRKTFSMGHASEKRYYLEGKYRR